jgi:hypothetical protein
MVGLESGDASHCVVFRQWFHQRERSEAKATWNQKSKFLHIMMRNRKASENEVLESFARSCRWCWLREQLRRECFARLESLFKLKNDNQ